MRDPSQYYSAQGLVQIDFDFYNPQESDYLATKNLLNQLFQSDAQLIGVEGLAELIVDQTQIGTTVKTDSQESDPYAFVTVVNLDAHKENSSVSKLRSYLSSKCPQLASILAQPPSGGHTGWVFSERLINMPPQVVPPMFRMLAEELQRLVAEGEPYAFDRLVFVSRTFVPTQELEANWVAMTRAIESGKRLKDKWPQQQMAGRNVLPYHIEDEIIQQHASVTTHYSFTQPRDGDRTSESLGVEQAGCIMIMPTSKLPAFVEQMNRDLAPPGV
ncbi:p21-C-terminal region-binding protein-domain-containing protein [Auriculariales sp. MPI-PUGE-AT-0066]|nr:p21-C-terminal region-binding protein-domain-containing protein [Auriculariales sp. MPI-PUGE-AT-0066]